MLGGERQIGLINELSPEPTLSQTAQASFQKPLEQVNQLTGYIFPGLSTDEERKKSGDRLASINHMLEDPRQGLGQEALNGVSNILGGLIPTLPFAAAGGAIGGIVAGGIGFHYLPNASIGGITRGTLEAYTSYKGFTIPEHFAEHYNAIENSLDTSHAIQDWASDNYGFLLAAAPLGAGYIAFKGVRGIIKHRNSNLASKEVDAELTRLLKQHDEILKQNEVK